MLAGEAKAIGRGGIAMVARATGVSRATIRAGLAEFNAVTDIPAEEPPPVIEPVAATQAASSAGPAADAAPDKKKRRRVRGGRLPIPEPLRQRRPGGGRKRTTDLDPTLKTDLESLLKPFEAGDPCSPLRWTCKTVSTLTAELKLKGHATSTRMVHELLVELGYTMQANKKTKESGSHADRDAQFEFINAKASEFQAAGAPVISVDTKKKELVGQFANKGSNWLPMGCPELVNTHDFMDPVKGRASPYGIYDIAMNKGFVNVGISADTSEFAVESIRRWWRTMGMETYSGAAKLFITADGGGSNGSRVRLWKLELQALADETGLIISVSHFPPGTSKWNKIEHRMFSFVSRNWRGRPLVSVETIVNLIGSTKTKPGLSIKTAVDVNTYEKGIKVSDEDMAKLNLKKNEFHGEWNYEIHPRPASQNGQVVL
jgi:Rhodopirellula transposase DDE domain